MIILGLSDIHGQTAGINRMQRKLGAADVAVMVGDITNFGKTGDVDRVVSAVRPHVPAMLGVSGNCDYIEVDRYLDKEGMNLHAKGRLIDGIGFVGAGGSMITPFQTPNEYTDTELESFLASAASQVPLHAPMVLVSHQPPLNTACDRLRSGQHVGSPCVRAFIEKHQPLVCFTGHIHEAVAVDRIGNTRIVNPGLLGKGRYAFARIEDGQALVEIRHIS
ncbi:MAG: metallophosphoesterase [Thermodesulfobacteriota bacterium]